MKKLSTLLFDSLVRGGIFTSLSASALIISIAIILNRKISPIFILIVLLMSISIYFFNFLGELRDDFADKPEEYRIIRKQKNALEISLYIILALTLLLSFFYGNLQSLVFIVVFLALGLLYTLYIKKLTRYVIGFKDIYVAICWNLIIPFYLLFHNYHFSLIVVYLMVFVLIRDLLNASYCDLKDIEIDRKFQLRTFAIVLGRNRLITSLQIINSISVAIVLAGVYFQIVPKFTLVLIVPVLVTSYLIHRSEKYKQFSNLNVDLEYFFWLILLFIFSGAKVVF